MAERNRYNKRRIGSEHEKEAADYLKEKGYKIIGNNIFTPFGEIDLLALDGNTLVFTEIKYRSSLSCGDPLEAVDYRKQKKICRAAFYYYTYNGFETNRPCRFDVIAVYKDSKITHVKNAFMFAW